MGIYVNPGNNGFARIAGPDYVDKTGLIALVNERIDGPDSLICISRPRRFGKSYAAQMLAAYYDCSCDSHALFDTRAIACSSDYSKHLNRYNIIYLDITGFISEIKKRKGALSDVPILIEKAIEKDLHALGFSSAEEDTLNDILIRCAQAPQGKKFVFIIDEWDAMIREAKNHPAAQEAYLNLLRGWFKNANFTPKVVAAAYMTGILPIKKDGSQSAISDFSEYSVLNPMDFADYFGFLEVETRLLCDKYGLDFCRAKAWYDGYTLGRTHSVYNPFSVMSAVKARRFASYWKKTSAAEALMTYIDMDQDGLQEDIVKLIAGESIEVDTDSFQNDVETFTCKDDVLTLMIHLGYLTYKEEPGLYDDTDEEGRTGLTRIPNEEVRKEFQKILRKSKHKELAELVRRSDQLLQDTLAGNGAAVAKAIQQIHDSSYAPTFYNNEQSLRYVVKLAYISCVDQYAKIEELPTGHGLADLVFLPKRRSSLPAMVIELKWNKKAQGALCQIKHKNYSLIPSQLGGNIVLVGINYDETRKEHTCKIEIVRR